MPLPGSYREEQLCFIAQEDYKALTIRLSFSPENDLAVLRKNRPADLQMLYYYDPIDEQRGFNLALTEARIHPRYKNPRDIQMQQVRWLRQQFREGEEDDWFYPDRRALRILIKKGMIHLKELMTRLGQDYRNA